MPNDRSAEISEFDKEVVESTTYLRISDHPTAREVREVLIAHGHTPETSVVACWAKDFQIIIVNENVLMAEGTHLSSVSEERAARLAGKSRIEAARRYVAARTD